MRCLATHYVESSLCAFDIVLREAGPQMQESLLGCFHRLLCGVGEDIKHDIVEVADQSQTAVGTHDSTA